MTPLCPTFKKCQPPLMKYDDLSHGRAYKNQMAGPMAGPMDWTCDLHYLKRVLRGGWGC